MVELEPGRDVTREDQISKEGTEGQNTGRYDWNGELLMVVVERVQ